MSAPSLPAPPGPPGPWSARLLAHPAPRLALWLLLAGFFFSAGLATPHFIGYGHDWFYFDHHLQAAYRSIAEYGQLPLWNPWHCGGLPGVGNLQTASIAPSTLLSLVFGLHEGARIFYLLLFVAGLEGTYQYTRHRGAGGLGALTAALVFAFSGRFVHFLHSGQPTFLAFLLFPWALLAFERGLRSWRWAVGGGFILAFMFLEAGAIPFPMTAIALGLAALFQTGAILVSRGAAPADPGPPLAWPRPTLVLLAMVGLAVALAAFAFLPRAETLVTVPRVLGQFDEREAYTLGHVLNMLFERGAPIDAIGPGAAYVGHFAGLLFLLALALRARGAWLFLGLSLVLVDLSAGWQGYLGVHHLLHSLPIVENIRAPYRYTVFVAFFVAVGAGLGVAAAEERLAAWASRARAAGRTAWRWAPTAATAVVLVALAGAAIGAVGTYTRPRLEGLFGVDVPPHGDEPFRQAIGNRWHAHVWPAVNLGSLTCFEEQPFPTSSRLRADLAAEEYLDDPGAGAVTRVAWSPREIVLRVALTRPATVLVNQNDHRGWGASVGRKVEAGGLLAVALDAGEHELVLRFSDPLFTAGAGVSALTLAGLGWIGWRRRRRPAAKEA